jgi:hypothetical protein
MVKQLSDTMIAKRAKDNDGDITTPAEKQLAFYIF